MEYLTRIGTQRIVRRLLAGGVGALCCLAVAGPSFAQTAPSQTAPSQAPPSTDAKLAIKALGQPGEFFNLTLNAGESRPLMVEVATYGAQPIAARTYPADAYTLINGGFGARLRTEPRGGPTAWTDYKEVVIQLTPGTPMSLPFNLTVPPGTVPGQYITSLVIENDQPIQGSGKIAINQVQRAAIALAVTVPGPETPGLGFGSATYTEPGGIGIVGVELKNTGNVLLKPSGTITVKDNAGNVILDTAVAMDSFYAFTQTRLETQVKKRLRPGAYTATLSLTDTTRSANATSQALPFTVGASPKPSQGQGLGKQISGSLRSERLDAVLIAVVVFVVLVFFELGRRRRKRRRAKHQPVRSY